MFAILAVDGPDPTTFNRAIAIAEAGGHRITRVTPTLVTIGASPSIATKNDAVFYGSAASVAAAEHRTAATLLDGAPDDVVACAVEAGKLTLAANRGNHRLFVHAHNATVTACSSLRLLSRAAQAPLDRSYEDFVLGFGFYPGTASPYAGIEALLAGQRLADGATTSTQPPAATGFGTPSSFDAAVPVLRDAFMNALETQAAGKRRHAVLLGGFDSMLVAASLRSLGHEVHTYTFSFGDPRFEQRNVADFVKQFGITHHPVTIGAGDVVDVLETFGDVFYQPGAQAHYQIFTLLASRMIAADGHDHIFNGDGCDAVFLSYPTVNRRAALNRRLSRLPAPIVRAAMAPLRTRAAEYSLGHVARTMRSMLDNLLLDEPARGHLPTRYLDDVSLRLLRQGNPPHQSESIREIRERLAAAVVDQSGPKRAFHGNGLTGQSRVKVDGAVASTGIPHFTPYLDPSLRAFVSSLPIDYLKKQDDSPATNGKELLVAMVRRYEMLPDAFVSQPKQSPVDSPVDGWYMRDVRARIITLLGHLPFQANTSYIDRLLTPKRAETWYRDRVSIGHHSLQAVGLLASYASFNVS